MVGYSVPEDLLQLARVLTSGWQFASLRVRGATPVGFLLKRLAL